MVGVLSGVRGRRAVSLVVSVSSRANVFSAIDAKTATKSAGRRLGSASGALASPVYGRVYDSVC